MRIFRSPRVEKGVRTAAVMLAVVIAFLVVRRIPPVARVVNAVEHVFVVVGTAIGNVIVRVTTPEDSLHAQLAQCEDRVLGSTEALAAMADAQQRASELETLLGYVQTHTQPSVVAHVMTRTLPQTATVRLDRGSRDGIAVGDAVVVHEGHLFGLVTAVTDTTADVRLVHSRESRIPAMVLDRNRTIGLVGGQEGSLLHMEYIPQDATLEEGNIVVTSGLEGGLPPNLVVGMVTTVIAEETSPFLEALIEPLYESREWTTVLVLTQSL